MAIQEGRAYWASITSPNTRYEPVYTVDLVLDDESANKFESEGYRVKTLIVNDEVVGRAINIKRKVNKANGNGQNKVPLLLDKNKIPMDELIGNGIRS